MELDKISAVVRPRRSWEAIDLGFIMVREWGRPLFKAWLVLTLPVYCLLQLALLDYGVAAALVIWWLKPLWERALLVHLSHRLFGEDLSFRQQWREFRRVAGRQLLPALTWRRLSPTRAFDLPVSQLEGLDGVPRARRLRTLHRGSGSEAAWLLLVGVHVESFIGMALYSTVYLLIPAGVEVDWLALLSGEQSGFNLFNNIAWYVGMTLVAPFYVAGGFALYLNRRIQLEAWDIDIVFRRLRQRAEARPRGPRARAVQSTAAVLALIAALALPLVPCAPAAAAPEAPDREQLRQLAQEVLAGEAFHQIETQKFPRFVLDWELDQNQPENTDVPEWLVTTVRWLANSAEWVLWAVMISLLMLLLYRYRHWLREFSAELIGRERREAAAPSHLFGLAVTPESLPDHPAAAAQQLWQQGRQREALSLLYRATLTQLMHRFAVDFHSAYTEGECLAAIERRNMDRAIIQYLSELTRCWQALAYAHQMPSTEAMQPLWQRWPALFDTPAAAATERGSTS